MTSSPSVSPQRSWLFALFLLAATFLAYYPAWHGEFLWDDYCVPHTPREMGDHYTLHGLDEIWFHPTHQYYPLTYTSCWVEYHLWGLNTTGFHLVNILLHALNAILLWLVLRRLKVPGAWLAGAIFALHPVNVETAAWISERKNTLSCFFYLCAILAALKFWLPEETAETASPAVARLKDWKFFWLAYFLFLCALFSKTTTIPLPAVILLLVWWKRGKLVRADINPMLFFLATAVAIGLITRHAEQHLGAHGRDFQISLVDRCLIAGRDFWFYLGKLFWPHPLIFVYPRWKIAPSPPLAWLSLLAFIPVLFTLWLARRTWGRPAFVALAYFAGMLFLMLGFFNIYFFLYSFVSDHFQYLAMMGPLALVCAGVALVFRRLGQAQLILAPVLAAALFILLGTLTWKQARMYTNIKTLWGTVAAQNPNAFLAHNNLGDIYMAEGQVNAALKQYQMSLALRADSGAYHNLGNLYLQTGRYDQAQDYFQKAIAIKPEDPLPYSDLGNLYLQKGQTDLAIDYFQKALKIETQIPMAWYNLGNAYIRKGQLDLAIQAWQKAVGIQTDFAPAHNNLANALSMKGRMPEAIQHWRSALATEPNLESAEMNLAWALATCPQDALRNGAEAVQLADHADELTGGHNPLVLRTLAAAFAENGDFPDAVAAAQQAIQSASLQGNKPLVADIQEQLKLYQKNQPFRDSSLASH
jgi:tetratricopeptide (TPR) repeat protein